MRYLCLLRGVNVGGKNTVSMTDLKSHLWDDGFKNVSSYINSGNILLESPLTADTVGRRVEEVITRHFKTDSELIKVLVLNPVQLGQIVNNAPAGFGSQPEKYHSDVLFPMGISSGEIIQVTEVNPEVDKAWQANGVVYFQRLSSERTKSRLNKIISQPVYKNVTIRSWNTTVKLLTLLEA